MVDPQRIGQVLNNLLADASRHSQRSAPIRVEGAVEGTHIALSISDQGRGIAPDRLPHLFRKRAGLAGGTGLGLAISKGLVEAHGGRIRAESGGPGLGARFTFTIPAAADAAAATAPPGGLPRPPGTKGREQRIVVLDDDWHTLRDVRDALADAGYAPLVTSDPDRLAGIIRAERPSLVLLDLMLPGVDGIELMGRVPALAEIPVIFISGYGRDETIARALESGAADSIVEPFSPTELVARVQTALRRHGAPETFALGELRIVYAARHVTLAGGNVPLTGTEFDLLRTRSRNAGRVVTQPDAPPPGLGTPAIQRHRPRPHRHEEAPQEAWRSRRQPHIHLQTARRRPSSKVETPSWPTTVRR